MSSAVSTLFTITLCLVALLVPAQTAVHYPDFFNVALMKPVTVEPTGATCGQSGSRSFCRSVTDSQSSLTCREDTCNMMCPHSSDLGYKEALFSRVLNPSWGGCVDRNNTILSPDQGGGYSVQFQGLIGQSDPCYLDLDPNWVVSQLILMPRWDVTLSMWIYPELNNTETGTIIDIVNDQSVSVLRLQLVNGVQLRLVTGDVTQTAIQWTLEPRKWQHVAFQIHDPFFGVFVNGEFVHPARYGISYQSPMSTDRIRIGRSFNDDDPFRGFMQDFDMYVKSATNREMEEIQTGSLPSLRLQTHCRCPSGFPRLKETDDTYCGQNEGTGRQVTERYRLNDKAHPLEFVNDDKTDDTFWLSEPETEETKLSIDFEDVFEIRHVEIRFYSPFPELLTIERMANATSGWEAWQYYSHDCQQQGMVADANLTSAADVNCKYLIPPNTEIPYSGGLIKLDLLAGRPGRAADVFSPELRQFLRASGVRVTLRGYPFAADPRHRYHGIYEISVNGTCDCHGHGKGCKLDSSSSASSYQCTCSPESFTVGDRCDQCANNTFTDPLSDLYDQDRCQPCVCNVHGTLAGTELCDGVEGQCPCKPNAKGRLCNLCQSGYYNLSQNNPDGCEPCQCQMAGTLNSTDYCDVTTGKCACKEHVHGFSCNQCKDGFYNLDESNAEGCTECGCNSSGTTGVDVGCDPATGQCTCKVNVTGRACDQCAPGTHGLSVSTEGCAPCDCDVGGSLDSSCDVSTGQCPCKNNVDGKRCTECKPGYYALDEADYAQNGCPYQCDCDRIGTDGGATTCAHIGGQCPCTTRVTGRKCDRCENGTYGFGRDGCLECGCEVSGTVNRNANCDAISGQCFCKGHVTNRRCDQCEFGYYGFSAEKAEGCTSCGCYPGGTVENGTCDVITGQCDCIPGAGQVIKGGKHCSAYVTSFIPTYGPLSGGTRVTLIGGYMSSSGNVTLQFGGITCVTDQSNSNATMTQCLSTSLLMLGREDLLNQPLPATLLLEDNYVLNNSFMYKEDPVISEVHPLRTFLKGGIVLTVEGEHLDSVFMPIMEVHMVQMRRDGSIFTDAFQSICETQSGEVMLCKTPEIIIPDDVTRKRRDVVDHDPGTNRLKRDSDDDDDDESDGGEPLNDDSLEFYLGFILDGVEIFRNMSDTSPDFGILEVYQNPEFEPFEERIKVFRTYWPYKDETVSIKGKRLNYGCTVDDYVINVGVEMCDDIDLATNRVVCRPPEYQPEPAASGHKEGAPSVVIRVGNIIFVPGFLKYETTFWDNETFRYSVIGGVIGFLLLLLLLILLCVLCCRRSKRVPKEVQEAEDEAKSIRSMELITSKKSKGNSYISAYDTVDSTYLNPQTLIGPDLLEVLPDDLRLRVHATLIDYRRMILGKLIGEGHFGRVHIGRLSDEYHSCQVPVAIKTLREHNVTLRDIIQFLEEATIMEEFKHENILSLMGVVLENNRAYVILPYMENGDLKSFITNEDNILTVGELIQFGFHVSAGMAYLSDQKFVHRDLACRNVMINKDFVVKVADFGLSRDIYESDYYKESELKRPLPIKWMSVESLERAIFTSKSDVWSYGVLLWELLTRGCTPYPDVDPFDMKDFLLLGNRMDRPDYAPDEIYSMMLQCWKADPRLRPTFHDIYERLADFLDMSTSKTMMRKRQSQKVPSSRGNSYLQLVG